MADTSEPRGLTRQLAQWIASTASADIPAGAHGPILRGGIDCEGVLLAGRNEPVVQHLLQAFAVRSAPQAGDAPVLVDRGWAAPAVAALLNTTAAHALDYDDTGLDGHPSVVLASATSALATAEGSTPLEARCAYALGYETWAELSQRDAPRHTKGWHPTAVFGCVGTAAAAAWLLRLDAARTQHALGIAASMAAGVVANFGSMTKPLQVGYAAHNGIQAALLARGGITASEDALEGPRGLLVALSPAGAPRLDGAAARGRPWRILEQGLNIKRFPICYALHRATDAALALHRRLEGRAVERITVELGVHQAGMLRQALPANGLDAKFSAPFAMACALLHGRVGLAELEDAVVQQPALRAMMARVEVRIVPGEDPQEPIFAPADRVLLVLADGTELASEPVVRALGHASRPLGLDALREKYLDCAVRSTQPAQALQRWAVLENEFAQHAA